MSDRSFTSRAAARRTTAVAGGLTCAAVVLAGCSGASSSNGSGGPSGQAVSTVTATKYTTGTATASLASVTWYGGYRPVLSLDPIVLADYPEETAIPNMCEPLVRVEPDYQLKPGLATSFGFKDDTHYVITIRKDVKFWDGTTMTAQDVAYSLGRNLDPAIASNYSGAFAAVSKIEVTGPDQITITTKHRANTLSNALATLGGAVVEKSFAQKAGRNFGSPSTGVMCTGPYKFTSYDGTSTLVMTKNANYWDPSRAAHANTFTFVYPADPTALANGLTSGKIDGALTLPSNLVAKLQNASDGKLFVGGEGSTPINVDLLFTKSTGASTNPQVRQALSKMLDRAGIAKAVFASTADPLYKVSGPGVWGYAKDTFKAAYEKYVAPADPAGAKKLVEQSGVGSTPLVFAYAAGDSESTQLATIVQQEAQQIGLTITLKGLPNQQYGSLFSDPKAREPYDFILTKNYVELPDPQPLDQLIGGREGNMNFSGYNVPAVNEALDMADQQTDPQARAKYVLVAEEHLAEGLPAIPIVQPRALVFENSRLTGTTLTFSYMTSPWAAAVGGK